MKLVKNEITTTLDMLNQTRMGRCKGLEFGLDKALEGMPATEGGQCDMFVTITVYKWVEGEDEEPPREVVEEAITTIEAGKPSREEILRRYAPPQPQGERK